MLRAYAEGQVVGWVGSRMKELDKFTYEICAIVAMPGSHSVTVSNVVEWGFDSEVET